MNILVPTDFSEVANVAVKYAAMLARKMDAKIILLHAIPHKSVLWPYTDDEMVEDAHKKQKKIKAILIKAGMDAGNIETHVFYQFPVEAWINDFIQKNEIDFAVIGTIGTTGLENVMLGSFALGMIEHLSVPIITVPPAANVNSISNIVYPADMKDTLPEIEAIVVFAKIFDAFIHIVYVSKNDIAENIIALEKLKKFTALTGYGKITIDVKTGTDIELLIEESIKDKHADLVAMFPKKGFFEQLFTGSVTREISYHIVIPLLAIKQT
ncbi:MAG: universal stress protein [Segetibacter sp.]|nr:universal stress protein [Segetibacter sp.]